MSASTPTDKNASMDIYRAGRVLRAAAAGGNIRLVKSALAAGASVRKSMQELEAASEHGFTEIVQLLLGAGAPCNATTFKHACKHGDLALINASIGVDDIDLHTGVIDLAAGGHLKCIKWIKARIEVCAATIKQALLKAIDGQQVAVIVYLVTLVTDREPYIRYAKHNGRTDTLRHIEPMSAFNTGPSHIDGGFAFGSAPQFSSVIGAPNTYYTRTTPTSQNPMTTTPMVTVTQTGEAPPYTTAFNGHQNSFC